MIFFLLYVNSVHEGYLFVCFRFILLASFFKLLPQQCVIRDTECNIVSMYNQSYWYSMLFPAIMAAKIQIVILLVLRKMFLSCCNWWDQAIRIEWVWPRYIHRLVNNFVILFRKSLSGSNLDRWLILTSASLLDHCSNGNFIKAYKGRELQMLLANYKIILHFYHSYDDWEEFEMHAEMDVWSC